MPLQVNKDGAVALSAAQGPVVDANDLHRRAVVVLGAADFSQ